MFYPLSAFIAYRYAKSNKASQTSFVSFINRFSVAGIALGLMALIIVVSVMNGLEGQLKQRILGIVPHIEITKTPIATDSLSKTPTKREVTETPTLNAEKSEDISETSTLNMQNAGEANKPSQEITKTPTQNASVSKPLALSEISMTPIEGVVASMDYREAEAVVQSRSDLRGVQVHGVQPSVMLEHTLVANHMEQGRFSDLTNGSFAAIIGRSLAIKLEARVGDRLRVMVAGASVYTPFGRMPSQRLVTVVGVFDMGSQMDDKVIYMNLDDVNRLMRDPKGSEQSLRLFLDDAFGYQAVVNELTDRVGVSVNNIRTWRERQGPLFDAVKMEKNMMTLMLLLIIAVAAFNIVSALVMVVTEKQGDICLLYTSPSPRDRG